MPVTKEQIIVELDRDELDYQALALAFGADAIPILREIVNGTDAMRSSKATYLASMIGDDEGDAIVADAAQHDNPVVRVAAAGAAGNLAKPSESVLSALLADNDAGVRKLALRSIADKAVPGLKAQVKDVADHDPQEYLRGLAADALVNLPT